MKIYLSGPMRGYAKFNFPAFDRAAEMLREEGHEVFNPAEKDREKYGDKFERSESGSMEKAIADGFDLGDALAKDTHYICKEADAIAMLPGWEYSGGARAEWALACTLKLKRIYLNI